MIYSKYKNYLDFETNIYQKYSDLLKHYDLVNKIRDQYWIYSLHSELQRKRGFKIHLSATILNAIDIANLFFNFLRNEKITINFKILVSLKELMIQNSGMNGYSQVGKFITIYPKNDEEFVYLLRKLENIYKGIKSISIPSDYRFQLSEVVYYRYGEFIKDYNYEDKRDRKIPEGVEIPVKDYFIKRYSAIPENYIMLEVINKNSKGGVYKVLNLESKKITLLKEAKYLSLIDFTNRDSVDRLMNEKCVLSKISKENFTPKVFSEFYVKDSYFLEMEYIDRVSLLEFCMENSDLSWFLKIINYFEIINVKYNLSYRDVSFNNILASKDGDFFVVDFEHTIDRKIVSTRNLISLFGTPGFYETNLDLCDKQGEEYEDIIGLIYLLYWSQHLEDYKKFEKLTYNSVMKFFMSFEKNRLDMIDENEQFYRIYYKGFNHLYRNFDELRNDFSELIECGAQD